MWPKYNTSSDSVQVEYAATMRKKLMVEIVIIKF